MAPSMIRTEPVLGSPSHQFGRVVRHADGEIVEGVAVEVARRQDGSELRPRARTAPDPELVPGLKRDPGAAAVEDVDPADIDDAVSGLADREIVEAVAVEVAGGERAAEIVPRPTSGVVAPRTVSASPVSSPKPGMP